MLINGFKNFNIGFNKVQNCAKPSAPKFNTGVQKDTFQKSSPSFCGMEENNQNSFYEQLYQTIMDISEDLIDQELRLYYKREKDVCDLIEASSDKKIQKLILGFKGENFEKFFKKHFGSSSLDVDYIVELFNKSGITTMQGFALFINTYNKIPNKNKTFSRQGIEAVEIYGALSTKSDIVQFPELLLNLYYNEEDKENGNIKNIDNTIKLLKGIGLNNFNDFDKKFGHLKEHFNEFENIQDKVDCVKYIELTYDSKIEFLDNLLKNNANLSKCDPKKIYANNNDIIDYFYYENDGESLSGIEDILNYVVSRDNLKNASLKSVAEECNNFETPEDTILFFEFLKDNDVNINEFNQLSGKNIISDISTIDILENKKSGLQKIIQSGNIKKQNCFDFYKNFKDVITTVCSEESGNEDGFKELFEIIKQNNFKDSSSILSYYNRISGNKNKQLTKEEFLEFFELLKFPCESIFTEAKKQKVQPIDILKQEKAKFEAIKPQIEKYKNSKNGDYFAGQSAFEIYKNHKETILANKDNIALTMAEIERLKVEDSEEFKKKVATINKFENFFDSRKEIYEFIEKNGIKLDGSEEEEKYINNCYKILNCVSENSQESKERIKYFAKSGFLLKSKDKLSELMIATNNDSKTRKRVLTAIADKKISSLTVMEKFFNKYNCDENGNKKLFLFIENLPKNLTFNDANNKLKFIEKTFKQKHLLLNINSNNINRINLNNFNNGEAEEIIELLNSIHKAQQKGGNFLKAMAGKLPYKNTHFSAPAIAKELAEKIGETKESYQNIERLLNISKKNLGLKEDTPSRHYAKCIKDILPKEFINFVNSNDWLKDKNGKPIQMNLHAKLRAIDRFVLYDADSIEELYKDSSKERLKHLINTIYTDQPTNIKGVENSKRMVVNFEHNSNIIEAVFSKTGDMITVVPKRHQR